MTKVALAFIFPIRIKRIANGERIIVPGDSRDDVEVQIIEDEAKISESPLGALREVFDACDKDLKRTRAAMRRRGKKMDTAEAPHE